MANEYKIPNGVDLLNQKGVNFADGTNPTDAVTKQQLDNAVAGLAWKDSVRVATTTNGTLATAFANGQTVDGVTLVTADRILLKDQSSGAENGIYVVAVSGAPTRATDADTAAEIKKATVMVSEGTVNAGKAFTQTTDTAITLNTTALGFSQVGGGTSYTADGNGIELSSTTFSLELDGATLSKSATGLKVNPSYVGNGLQLIADVASIKLDTASNLTVSSSGLKVDTTSLTRIYTATLGTVTGGSPITVTHSLGKKNVLAQVYIESTGEGVGIAPFLVDTTSFTLTFAASQATGYYRVVVVA